MVSNYLGNLYFDPSRLFELGAKMYTANKNEWPEKMVFFYSTLNRGEIQLYLTRSKWNTGKTFTIFDPKMMLKSGLDKIFLKFFHGEAIFF